jgi:hypothetical protein
MKFTRAEIKEFGAHLQKGDVLVNRYQEHKLPPAARQLTVVQDVPGRAFFILQDQDGAVTWMRTRTIMARYNIYFSGPKS